MNEFGRVAEEGPQVEVFAVRGLHSVIPYVDVAVEPRPRVDAPGPVGGVQHVGYPQVHQPRFILSREPVDTWGEVDWMHVLRC